MFSFPRKNKNIPARRRSVLEGAGEAGPGRSRSLHSPLSPWPSRGQRRVIRADDMRVGSMAALRGHQGGLPGRGGMQAGGLKLTS